eukprot:TRINITY_DN1284_c0_g1_i2.p1 TRINITY_DN1284_c0_g1~~TRINITY_DN1284_c0_g1_i2.p1  ORF type:complete len:226 (+),score=40.97 TRINITY_DN1284_c0_g1_i2:147-824(+)
MDFGQLCNEFKCRSSPSVEATARQLARDILEMRNTNKALEVFAISVKYKDPLRSFTGREKYTRSSWIKKTLSDPLVTVQEMSMLSTSVLNVRWTVRGRLKAIGFSLGHMSIVINSTYTLNQISGQVLEHVEEWNVSSSSGLGQAYFWASRVLDVTTEAGNDLVDVVNNMKSRFAKEEENRDIFADPMGDPTKFFQMDGDSQRDVYQVGLFLAFMYLIVQFLRSTL